MEITNIHIIPRLISSLSKTIFSKKEHVLLGISPFNSYFSEEMIGHWVQWAQNTFSSFNLFVPDTLPIYTFLALGYDEAKAKKKAERQAAYLKNKIFRALTHRSFTDEEAKNIVIDMNVLQKNEFYQNIKNVCYSLYEENAIFRNECDKCTGWVLNNQAVKDKRLANKNMAVKYILDEMPLFMNTPAILNTVSSLFTYHQTPEIINYLYNDKMQDKFIALNQGYIELSVTNTEDFISNGVLIEDEFR